MADPDQDGREGRPLEKKSTEVYAVNQISGLESVISELSLLVLYSAPRGFSPGTQVFPSPQRSTIYLIYSLPN